MSGEEAAGNSEGAEMEAAPPEHPAVIRAGFDPTTEKARYIIGKVLKWAAIGAVIGAVALPILGSMAGISLASTVIGAAGTATGVAGTVIGVAGKIPGVGPILATAAAVGIGVAGWMGGSSLLAAAPAAIAAGLGAAVAVGAAIGLAVGLIGGLVSGFSGADDHVANKRDDIINMDEALQDRVRLAAEIKRRKLLQDAAYERQLEDLRLGRNPNALLPGANQQGATRQA